MLKINGFLTLSFSQLKHSALLRTPYKQTLIFNAFLVLLP